MWIEENAFVSLVETPYPWLLESELIFTAPLPLSLDQNLSHAFLAGSS